MIKQINDFFESHNKILIAGITVLTIITLALTLMPAGKVMPEQVWSFDKLGHLLIFGSWTFLIGYYQLLTKPHGANLFTIFLIGVAFGIAVEGLQYVMNFNRHPDFIDVVFDSLGCFGAVFCLHKIAKIDAHL